LLVLVVVGACDRGEGEEDRRAAGEGVVREKKGAKVGESKTDPRADRLVVLARQEGLAPLEKMIDSGMEINAFNSVGINALMAAFLAGRVENARLLLARGADPLRKNTKGDDAVTYALMSANDKIVRLLEERKLLVDRLDRGILVRLACLGDRALLERLLVKRQRVDWRDERQETALIHAVRCRNKENARYLVKAGADVNLLNDRKRNALTVAAIFDFTELARFLLQHGADATVIDFQKRTALDWATLLGRKKMIRLLSKEAER
jgi:ankyrin repeat protein